MRSVNRRNSPTYRVTDSRHRALNSSTPNFSISPLPVKPSSRSTSNSTGMPWQSHPAIRGTRSPFMVRYRGKTSLKTRASTWCTPGRPFAVGGPSKNRKNGPSAVRSRDFPNTDRSRHRARTRCSSAGISRSRETGSNVMSDLHCNECFSTWDEEHNRATGWSPPWHSEAMDGEIFRYEWREPYLGDEPVEQYFALGKDDRGWWYEPYRQPWMRLSGGAEHVAAFAEWLLVQPGPGCYEREFALAGDLDAPAETYPLQVGIILYRDIEGGPEGFCIDHQGSNGDWWYGSGLDCDDVDREQLERGARRLLAAATAG